MKSFVLRLFNRTIGLLYIVSGLCLIKLSISRNLSPDALWMVIPLSLILIGLTVFVSGKTPGEIVSILKDFYKDKRIRAANKKIDKQVKYALQYLDKEKFKVIEDISLKVDNLEQHFNHIVISPNAIFNIEVKTLSNPIFVDSIENCIKDNMNEETRVSSLDLQCRNYKKVLEKIINYKYPVIDVIVIKNDVCNSSRNTDISVKVISHNSLIDFIENYSGEQSIDDIAKIKNILFSHKIHSKEKDNFISEFYSFKFEKENFLFLIIGTMFLAVCMRGMVNLQKRNDYIKSIKVQCQDGNLVNEENLIMQEDNKEI